MLFSGPHGHFSDRSHKLCKHFPYTTWELLHSVFPKAKCFRELRFKRGERPNDIDDEACPECEAEDSAEDALLKRIEALLHSGKVVSELEMTAIANKELALTIPEVPGTYWIVHKDDLEAWKRFTKVFGGKSRGKRVVSVEKIESLLAPNTSCARQLFLDDSRVDQMMSHTAKLEMVSSFLRPIVCSKHGKPIDRAIFGPSSTNGEACRKLSHRVAILDEETYKEYITNLATVVVILSPLNETENPLDRSIAEDSCDAEEFMDECDLIRSLHPRFQKPTFEQTTQSENCSKIVGDLGGANLQFNMFPCVCSDPECRDAYAAWEQTEYPSESSLPKTKCGTSACSGSDAVILLDSDIEEVTDASVSIRVFNIAAGANVDKQISNLAQCAGVAVDDVAKDHQAFVRRSRRKRKTVYPVGAVLGDDVIRAKLDYNLAALRLCLMQECADFELNHSLKAFVSRPDSSQVSLKKSPIIAHDGPTTLVASKLIDLPFALNTQSLISVCESELGETFGDDFKPSEHLCLVRQGEIDFTSLEGNQEELMEVLIELSNNKDASATENGKSKRNRSAKAPEKGFTGTLLTGAPKPEESNEEEVEPAVVLMEDDRKPAANPNFVPNPKNPIEELPPAPREIVYEAVDDTAMAITPILSVVEEPSAVETKKPPDVTYILSSDDDDDVKEPCATTSKQHSRVCANLDPLRVSGTGKKSVEPSHTVDPPASNKRQKKNGDELDFPSDSGDDDEILTQPTQPAVIRRTWLPGGARSTHTKSTSQSTLSKSRISRDQEEADQRVSLLVAYLQNLEWVKNLDSDQTFEAATWTVANNPTQKDADILESLAEYKLGELNGSFAK